jgi:hypothetical protein
VIHSNANLGVHGQGLLNLSGPGDWIEAQRLVLSLFYSIHVRQCLIFCMIYLYHELRELISFYYTNKLSFNQSI